MRDKDLSDICEKHEELKGLKAIRSRYHKNVEERLSLTCQTYERRHRHRSQHGRQKDISSRSREKRASQVYSTVLDENPNAFLPFLIAISPRTCRSFKVDKYCTKHIEQNKIVLTDDTRKVLEDMGSRRKISEHDLFKKFMNVLFPAQPESMTICQPRPITTADGDKHWAYNVADMVALGTIFGDQSYIGVESHPRRIAEKERGDAPMQQATQLVPARLPQGNYHDGIFWIHTGQVIEAIQILFPNIYQRISWLLETKSSLHHTGHPGEDRFMAEPRETCEVVEAHFMIEWASIPGITGFFNSPINDAIDRSNLRDWEKEHKILDVTNCVTMEVKIVRNQPPVGIIRLRMEFRLSTQIARSMYSYKDI